MHWAASQPLRLTEAELSADASFFCELESLSAVDLSTRPNLCVGLDRFFFNTQLSGVKELSWWVVEFLRSVHETLACQPAGVFNGSGPRVSFFVNLIVQQQRTFLFETVALHEANFAALCTTTCVYGGCGSRSAFLSPRPERS